MAADVGQNQIWCANNFEIRDGRFLTTGGLGTMGYSIPAALGAKLARPNREVVAICGDGAFQMSMCELGTIAQNHIGVKIIIMRNTRLGMVRELQDNLYGHRHAATILDETMDFLKIAEAYGIPHAMASSNEEALKQAEIMMSTPGPYLLVCNVHPIPRHDKEAPIMKYTISVLVENHPGVLSKVSGLFSRRGFNIDSLAVGVTEDSTISRMTIVVNGDEYIVEQVEKRLNKVIPVIKVKTLNPEELISRELSLIKVGCTSKRRPDLMKIAELMQANIVDVTPKQHDLSVR